PEVMGNQRWRRRGTAVRGPRRRSRSSSQVRYRDPDRGCRRKSRKAKRSCATPCTRLAWRPGRSAASSPGPLSFANGPSRSRGKALASDGRSSHHGLHRRAAMHIPPFALDQWLDEHHFSPPPVELDLAASTGPKWTLRELLTLADPEERDALFDAPVYYAPAAGHRKLRESVAEMADVSPDQVLITTGAQEALWAVFLVAAEPGANVLVPQPGFPPFLEIPRLLGLEVRPYQLRPDAGYRADSDDIRKLVDGRPRILLVNSPHNPTGAVLSDEELDTFHGIAADARIQLVVDQVYHP